jgi:phosphohistidine phosphatase SixA
VRKSQNIAMPCTSSAARRGFLAALPALCLLRPGFASAGEDLVGELRAGAALLMRHAQTVPGVGDPTGWRLEDCASQRNLNAEGVAHAQRIGRWFQQQQLSFVAVRNSPWCRTRETARLAVGQSEDWPALGNIFEDRRGADVQAEEVLRYIGSLKAGQRVLLVSHGSTIGHIVPDGAGLAPGEFVAVRAAAASGTPPRVLGRFRVP